MKYLYIDGDNIGLKIEQNFLTNNELGLKEINRKVIIAIDKISVHLKSIGQEIIFAGADGIISKGKQIDYTKLIKFVRFTNSDLTFSIGVGNNLKDCYIALRYAKSYGKNILIELVENEFIVIEE